MQISQLNKKSRFTLLLMFLCSSVFGQKTIKGRITVDRDSIGLPGVTVRIKATNLATQTNANGNYELKVPDSIKINSIVIQISFMGFKNEEMALDDDFFKSGRPLNFQLTEPILTSAGQVLQEMDPVFPWPPPEFSSKTVLNKDYFKNSHKLSDIDKKLKNALSGLGYSDMSYYYIDGGFALVTKIEQIESDGTPYSAPARWSARTLNPKLNWKNYIHDLIFPKQGFFRIMVFAVTDKSFKSSGTKASKATAESWLSGGLNVLPASIGDKTWSVSHNCTALVYEFMKPETSDATLVKDGPSADEHLIKTKILTALNH